MNNFSIFKKTFGLLYKPQILLFLLIFSPYLYHGAFNVRFDHLILLVITALNYKIIFKSIQFKIFLYLYFVFIVSTYYSSKSFNLAYAVTSVEWYGRGLLIYLWCRKLVISEKDLNLVLRVFVYSSVPIGFFALLQLIPATSMPVTNFFARWYSDPNPFTNSSVSFLQILLGGGRAVSFLAQPGTYGMYFLVTSIILMIAKTENLFANKGYKYVLILTTFIFGPLALSKAFFYGVPLFILYYSSISILSGKLKTVSSIAILLIFTLFLTKLPIPNLNMVTERLKSLKSPGTMTEDTFGARYGSQGVLKESMKEIEKRPIIGYGFVSGLRMCDSLYVPILIFGGWVALLIYGLFVISCLYPLFKNKMAFNTYQINRYRVLILTIFIFFLIFGLGYPTITQDKIGDFFWVFLGSFNAYIKKRQMLIRSVVSQ